MFSLKAKIKPESKMLFCMLFMSALCCSTELFADGKQKKEGNKISYNGNVFELKESPKDTIYVDDIMTKERVMKVSIADSFPIKMNNEKIYSENEVDVKVSIAKGEDEIFKEFFKKNRATFSMLGDGGYYLQLPDLIIGKDGKAKYYKPQIMGRMSRLENPTGLEKWENKPIEPLSMKIKIEDLVEDFVLNLQFNSAMLNGQKAISETALFGYNHSFYFVVKNHKAQTEKEAQGLDISGD